MVPNARENVPEMTDTPPVLESTKVKQLHLFVAAFCFMNIFKYKETTPDKQKAVRSFSLYKNPLLEKSDSGF